MSGFIAIFNTKGKPVDETLLNSLTHSLKFRGPDRQNIWIDGNVGLGHALFKTTFEAEYENQPSSIDGNVWITCNARIDDRKNLLKKMGISNQIDLSKTPDSDLILLAYRKWGEKCLDHLLGDFAFVIWDKVREIVFAARDRFGSRQLYFTHKDQSLILSNTLNTIRQHPSITNTFNDKAIAGFLLFGNHTWVDKGISVFKDIQAIPPAHKLVYRNKQLTLSRYWDIPMDLPLLRYKNKLDYIEHFQDLFRTAVKDRIRTDSIVISMSGGLDSSSIAATTVSLRKELPHPLNIQAVTAVFDTLMPCKERHYAGIVAKHLGIPIHYLNGDDYPLIRPIVGTTRPLEIDNFTYWLDFQKLTASYGRVVLTGASADNLFEFSPAMATFKEVNPLKVLYDIYRLKKDYGQRPGLGLRSLFTKKSKGNVLIEPYPFPEWFNKDFARKENLQELWEQTLSQRPSPLSKRHPAAHNSLLGTDWNTDDIMMVNDFTLAEERDPFLDLRLVEFLFSIPSVPWFFKKDILRQTMKGILPENIVHRPKTPLGNLQKALIKKQSSNWLAKWEISPEMTSYISPDTFPLLLDPSIDEITLYQVLRVVTLNEWINSI